MKASIVRLQAIIKDAYERIKKIQTRCPHKNVTKKHWGNTGNYDPTCDCYGTDFICLDCDKHWTEKQK